MTTVNADAATPTELNVLVRPLPDYPDAERAYSRSSSLLWRRSANAVEILHPWTERTISDSVMVASLSELVELGVLSGQEQFEDAAVQMICSSAASEESAWRAYYLNSINELDNGTSPFSPVHRRARSLIAGHEVLEVGCCFGFFALACARDGHSVRACDISPGAIDLLTTASASLRIDVDACVGNALALPYPDDHVDTVTLIHLLEHLDVQDTTVAVTEALRVARHRVVIAVPFEEEPTEHFGHLLRLTEDDLRLWADRVDHAGAEIFTDHGGWLILTPHR
ncbi:methyltransferase domain-containing protein [Gordonia pseudamarae]|uniref:mycofactocin oligosaccharide methyltransferase MftM n=1 Tax=Gordonia TaxID=2053 RepID=UPI0019A3F83D|nr:MULTISPECIES: mycofactocin oligosaccharide methyltransferase MftM [Gordonia]MBD0023247.1 class I SAM-dependent methyltransferase [Gordonia sp. (in: high G+C Gram-positive bacteria)]QHN25929.1 methyltransferase domain-containing protein [Gordonia pseudamarae]